MFHLLSGLRHEFEYIKIQILGNDSLRSINKVLPILLNEESRQKAMSNPVNSASDHAALNVSSRGGFTNHTAQRGRGKRGGNNRPVCSHCKKTGHSADRCLILHPHLAPNKSSSTSANAVSHSEDGNLSQNTSQPSPTVAPSVNVPLDIIQQMLSALNMKTGDSNSGNMIAPTANAKGISFNKLQSQSTLPWIMDSGATHHMAGSSTSFSPSLHFSGDSSAFLADGSPVPIVGILNVPLS